MEEQKKAENSQATTVSPENNSYEKSYKKSWKKWLVVYLAIGLVLYGLIYYFVFARQGNHSYNSNYSYAPTVTQVSPTINANNESNSSITANWITYTIPEVGLQFKLPPSYGDVKEQIVPGEKGTQICLESRVKTSFHIVNQAYAGGGCNSNYSSNIRIGTTSFDYEAGRSGSFTDLQGFTIQNGKYYAKFVSGKTVDLPQNATTKISNINNIDVLKIKGKFDPNDGPSLMNSLGDDIGLLINTNKTTYTGMAMAFKLSNDVTEETVDQIISTVKFTQ